MVKIRTNRLYFSHGHAPSAIGAGAGGTRGDSVTGPSMWSSLPVLPAAPRSGRGIHLAYSAYAFRLGGSTTNRVEHSG